MNIGKPFRLDVLTQPHTWFAWKPVIVEHKGADDHIYGQVVWLKKVRRTLIRIQGVSIFKYEPK